MRWIEKCCVSCCCYLPSFQHVAFKVMGSMQLASGEMILELRREARLMICIEKNMIFNDERMSSRRKKQKGRGRNEGKKMNTKQTFILFYFIFYFILSYFIFKKILFIYLSERESTSRGSGRERKKQAPRWAGSLIRGLHPRTLGSWSKTKTGAQLTEPPKGPYFILF